MKSTKILFAMTLCAVGLADASQAHAAEPPFAPRVGLDAQDVSSGTTPAQAADMDRDGDMDIVFAGGTSLWWYENTDGLSERMTERNIDPALFGSNIAFVTDVDDDGDLDIVSSGEGLRWYENIEDASGFQPHELSSDSDVVGELGVGDIDGDGLRDIVLADTNTNVPLWFRNPGAQSDDWGTGETIGTDFDRLWYVAVADVVGDGRAEVILAGNIGGNSLGLLEFDSGWTQSLLDAGSGVEELRVADVDGDSDIDILVGQDEHAVVLRNLGDGVFGPLPITDSDGSDSVNFQIDAGDIDADGDLDLLTTHFDQQGGLTWFENDDGDFTIEHVILEDVSTFANIELGDMDCDGDADVVVFAAVDDVLDVYIFENLTNEPNGDPAPECIGAGDDGAAAGGDGGGDTTGGVDETGGSDDAGDDAGSESTSGAANESDGSGGGSTAAGGDDGGGGGCSVHPVRRGFPFGFTILFGLVLLRTRRG